MLLLIDVVMGTEADVEHTASYSMSLHWSEMPFDLLALQSAVQCSYQMN